MLQAIVTGESVALALLTVLVVALLRSHGEVLRALHRIGAGVDPDAGATEIRSVPGTNPLSAAPVVGVTLDDESVSWPVAGERDVLLAFLSSGCEACAPFWDALGRRPRPAGDAEVLVVTAGPDRESETMLRRLAPAGVPLVMSTQAWTDYGVPGSPHFVYVDGATATVVGEGTAPGWDQVVTLLERAAADSRLGRSRPPSRRDHPLDVDAELTAAGVGPHDLRLYADPDAARS